MKALTFFECILIFTTSTSFRYNKNEIIKQLDVTIKICRSKVKLKIGFEVKSKVRFKVESIIGSKVGSKVGSDVGSKVRFDVGSEVKSKVRSNIGL